MPESSIFSALFFVQAQAVVGATLKCFYFFLTLWDIYLHLFLIYVLYLSVENVLYVEHVLKMS